MSRYTFAFFLILSFFVSTSSTAFAQSASCPAVPPPVQSCANVNGWSVQTDTNDCISGYQCQVSTEPTACPSGTVRQLGQCVPTSCNITPLLCRSDQHIVFDGCSESCVKNSTAAFQCSLVCAPGYSAVGLAGSCTQACVQNPGPASPTLSVTVSPSSILAGSNTVHGGTVHISWSTQNAPANTGVFLYLITADGDADLFLAGGLPTTGTYDWEDRGAWCTNDSTCMLTLGDPGTYRIMAQLYTPITACYGSICPTNTSIEPTLLTQSQSSTFTVMGNPAQPTPPPPVSAGLLSRSSSLAAPPLSPRLGEDLLLSPHLMRRRQLPTGQQSIL
jgi:hypothetical protein